MNVVSCDWITCGSIGSTFPLLEIQEVRLCRVAWVVVIGMPVPSRAQEGRNSASNPNESSALWDKFIGMRARYFSTSKFRELQAGVYPPGKPELQGPKRVIPISVRRAMVAIVTKQDISAAEILKAAADSLPRLKRPVSRRHGPHNHLRQPRVMSSPVKLRATKAKRRTDTDAAKAGRFQYRILAAIQLIRDALPAVKERVGMTISVVSNDVLSRDNFCGQAGILVYILSEDEKRRGHAMGLEK